MKLSKRSVEIERARLRWLAIARVLLYVTPLTIAAVFIALQVVGHLPYWVDPEWMVWLGLGSIILGIGASQLALRQVRRQVKQMAAELLGRLGIGEDARH